MCSPRSNAGLCGWLERKRPVEQGQLGHNLARQVIDDETARLVYADWLDDHDHPERAGYVRLGVKLAHTAADDPHSEELRYRKEQLSTLLAESGWRELWDALDARRVAAHSLRTGNE